MIIFIPIKKAHRFIEDNSSDDFRELMKLFEKTPNPYGFSIKDHMLNQKLINLKIPLYGYPTLGNTIFDEIEIIPEFIIPPIQPIKGDKIWCEDFSKIGSSILQNEIYYSNVCVKRYDFKKACKKHSIHPPSLKIIFLKKIKSLLTPFKHRLFCFMRKCTKK